jgi:hypothetical protein
MVQGYRTSLGSYAVKGWVDPEDKGWSNPFAGLFGGRALHPVPPPVTPPLAAPPLVIPPLASPPPVTPTLADTPHVTPPVTPAYADEGWVDPEDKGWSNPFAGLFGGGASQPVPPPVTPPLAAPPPVTPQMAGPPPVTPTLAVTPPVTPPVTTPYADEGCVDPEDKGWSIPFAGLFGGGASQP